MFLFFFFLSLIFLFCTRTFLFLSLLHFPFVVFLFLKHFINNVLLSFTLCIQCPLFSHKEPSKKLFFYNENTTLLNSSLLYNIAFLHYLFDHVYALTKQRRKDKNQTNVWYTITTTTTDTLSRKIYRYNFYTLHASQHTSLTINMTVCATVVLCPRRVLETSNAIETVTTSTAIAIYIYIYIYIIVMCAYSIFYGSTRDKCIVLSGSIILTSCSVLPCRKKATQRIK